MRDDEGFYGFCDMYVVAHPNLDPSPAPSSMPSSSSSPTEKSSLRPSSGPSESVQPTKYPTASPTPQPTITKYFCASSVDLSYCDETLYPNWETNCDFRCNGKGKSCLGVSCPASNGPPPPPAPSTSQPTATPTQSPTQQPTPNGGSPQTSQPTASPAQSPTAPTCVDPSSCTSGSQCCSGQCQGGNGPNKNTCKT